jgi:hypothetical protein
MQTLSATASSNLPNNVSFTDISPQFLHSKPSVPGIGSVAQTYKTCQHQQKVLGMYIFSIHLISYCSCFIFLFLHPSKEE